MYNYRIDNKLTFKQFRELWSGWLISIRDLDNSSKGNKEIQVNTRNKHYDDMYVIEIYPIYNESKSNRALPSYIAVALSEYPYWDKQGCTEIIKFSSEYLKKKLSRVFVRYGINKAVLFSPLCAEDWDFHESINIGVDGDVTDLRYFGLCEELADAIDVAVSVDLIIDDNNDSKESIILYEQKIDPITHKALPAYTRVNDSVKIDFKVSEVLRNLMIEAEEEDLAGNEMIYDSIADAIWVDCKNAIGAGKMTKEQWHKINARYPL